MTYKKWGVIFYESSRRRTGSTLYSGIDRALVKDVIYQIRAQGSQWIAQENVHVVLITGDTGFTARDLIPEAITPLLDKQIEGFGELFRQVSYAEIGTPTIQSRALAGLAKAPVTSYRI